MWNQLKKTVDGCLDYLGAEWVGQEWQETLQAAVWLEPTSEPLRDSIIHTIRCGVEYLETVAEDMGDRGLVVPSACVRACAADIETALGRYDR